MRTIHMVDTRSQYHNIKPAIDKAVLDVIESTAFINGKPVADFASALARYNGSKYCIPCANGTDALQIAMMALGLEPGDEVITPSFTYIATTEVIALLKLTPVFVEVDPLSFCIDPAAIEKAITPRTRAIVPVHLYGQSAHLEKIMAIAEKNNLFVIEDNAQAIGTDYLFTDGTKKKTGSIGQIGTTSFYPSKSLGAYGDGGAIFTDDEALATKLKMVANHGQSKQYHHDLVGCNSRLDSLQAAILSVKLEKLDEYISARRKVARYYDKAFSGNKKIRVPYRATYSDHSFHQYTLVLEKEENPAEWRNGLKTWLAENQVPSMIYYPLPAHKQKMFSRFNVDNLSLPVTEWLTERVISLPIHTEMDEEQLAFISSKVLEYVNR